LQAGSKRLNGLKVPRVLRVVLVLLGVSGHDALVCTPRGFLQRNFVFDVGLCGLPRLRVGFHDYLA